MRWAVSEEEADEADEVLLLLLLGLGLGLELVDSKCLVVRVVRIESRLCLRLLVLLLPRSGDGVNRGFRDEDENGLLKSLPRGRYDHGRCHTPRTVGIAGGRTGTAAGVCNYISDYAGN